MWSLPAILPMLLLVLPFVAYGTGFDIDLKDLQKPSYPASEAAGRKTASSPKKRKTVAKQEAATAAAPRNTTKAALPSAVAAVEPETVHAPVEPVTAELVLTVGDGCRLAEQVAVAVARTVPVERLLNGLGFDTTVAVVSGDLQLLLSCGLADAEAYTYNRLLDEHRVQLLNLKMADSVDQTMDRLLTALGLSYLLEQHELAKGGEDHYLIMADTDHTRPLRLILQPSQETATY